MSIMRSLSVLSDLDQFLDCGVCRRRGSGLRTGDSAVSSRRRRLQRNSAICIDLYISTVVMDAIFAQTFM